MILMDADLAVAKYCNRLRLGLFGDVLEIFSRIPVLVFFWSAAALGIFYFDDATGRTIIWTIIAALVLHFGISEGFIKILLGRIIKTRVRPYLAHPDSIRPLGRKFRDSSFPSSHMSSVVAIMTVLSLFYPKFIFAACLIAIVLAFARIRGGMHYPSDVLAGAALGLAYGWSAFILVS